MYLLIKEKNPPRSSKKQGSKKLKESRDEKKEKTESDKENEGEKKNDESLYSLKTRNKSYKKSSKKGKEVEAIEEMEIKEENKPRLGHMVVIKNNSKENISHENLPFSVGQVLEIDDDSKTTNYRIWVYGTTTDISQSKSQFVTGPFRKGWTLENGKKILFKEILTVKDRENSQQLEQNTTLKDIITTGFQLLKNGHLPIDIVKQLTRKFT